MSEGALWPDPDHSPGGTSTLRRLHDLVPAAEEADILEEVADAEAEAYWQRLMDEVPWPDDDPPDSPDSTDELRAEIPSTEQIIAMLHRTLGATVIDEFQLRPEVLSTEQIIAMLHRTLGATVIDEFRVASELDSD